MYFHALLFGKLLNICQHNTIYINVRAEKANSLDPNTSTHEMY